MNAPTVPKRDDKRSRVFLSVEIDGGSGPVAARIRDISRTGALVESKFVPNGSDTVQLTCGSTRLQARVAWANRGWFGVEFDTPLLVGNLVDDTGTKLQVSAPRTYHASEPLDRA